MEYYELDKHFKKPKDWNPGVQSFYDRYKRIPRKLKKRANTVKNATDLGLGNMLWYLQHLLNPNYNKFLIKLVIEYYEKSNVNKVS